MKIVLFLATTVLAAHAQTQDLLNAAFVQPVATAKVPAILRLHSDITPDGSFTYTFDTENGISAHAEGSVAKSADPDQSIQTIRGQYSYTGPDGVQYSVQYIADHNGFQAYGEHLPTPPPIPEAIQRALEHNAAHPEEDDSLQTGSPVLSSQPIVAAPLARFSPLVNPTAAPPITSLPKLTQTLLPQTQSQPLQITVPQNEQLQFSQLQPQALQLAQLQSQQLQSQQLQPQQLQPQQLQPQQLQPQQLQLQQLQPQQLQPQQLQPQQLQPQQLQPQQFQTQQFQTQQFQTQQLQSQQLQPQQLQVPQLQTRQLQPQQLQTQQLQPQPQIQPQDFLTQFAPNIPTFDSQRRTFTTKK